MQQARTRCFLEPNASLGDKIWRLVFSRDAASQCVCFEDDDEQSNAKFTIAKQSAADGFGKQKFFELKYAAVGGNHLNQLMVAVDQRVPTGFPGLADENGRMCRDKISKKDPYWKEAMSDGLKWLVIHKSVATLYPTLPNLIKRARNAVSQNQSGESIIEILLEIYAIAVDMETKTGKAPNWSKVQDIVMQSEPPLAEYIPVMCNWVLKFGMHNLAPLTEFLSVCVPSQREINPDVLKSVANWPTLASGKHKGTLPELALAVVMAEYNCPEEKVENGICSFIKPGKISTFPSSAQNDMTKVNELLKDFKEWAQKTNLMHNYQVAFNGKTYCLLARMILEIGVPEVMEGCPYEAGLSMIAEEVIALDEKCFDPSKPILTNEWKRLVQKPKTKKENAPEE